MVTQERRALVLLQTPQELQVQVVQQVLQEPLVQAT